MKDIFDFADELGPIKVVHVYDPKRGLKAVVVVDNVARGPSIGGIRMAPDVSAEEAFRLARAMTLKNSAAGLPHGGGKTVLFGDPKMAPEGKEELIRAFARAILDLAEYIPGPDMGTDERCMAWIHDEIGRAVGLPPEIGGIPLDEIGATGWGLAASVETALPYCDFALKGARMAIQGFGSVGKHAARFLAEKGAVLVGACDSRGAIVNPRGIDVGRLIALKESGMSVADYPDGERLPPDRIIDVECEIWIPAARPDVVHRDNVHRLRTRLVPQGANIPFTLEAERVLHEKGVLVIPDFIANAGGVICAAVEYHGGTQSQAFQTIDEKIRANTAEVLARARKEGRLPREAAVELAETRVRRAAGYRR
ncbi:MAG TPA: Glu/Leu/Phe/Val dehydrogenase [candidate division Zixibacteria bacterium]|nr:Glu/Leu/Phe/Val dehydrogenase [candidate division Zixibacteria bacterium]